MFDIFPEAFIDTKAIQNNFLKIKSLLSDRTTCSAVVKNDAYGLGAQVVSQKLYEAGCREFWVAYLKEAIDIRRVLPFDAKIYFLQGFHPSDIEFLKVYKIIPVVNSVDEFCGIKGQKVPFVLHVDTGLSRLGIRESDLGYILENIKNEELVYVISHLACSEDVLNIQNKNQKERFDKTLEMIRQVIPVKAGISASGGTLLGPDYAYDTVRIGGFLFGIHINSKLIPENVFSLQTKVLQKYEVQSGTKVGYGAKHETSRKTKIAVISIGYADGIKRALANRGKVLFYDDDRFFEAKMIGNISMDLIACDVTDIKDELTDIYSKAVVIDKNYSINEMAKDAGTIAYEVLTSINFKSKRFEIKYIH